MRRFFLTLSLLSAVPLVALVAQDPPPPPPARAEDVASIDAIMAAVYDVISGPAGQKRDWDRFRSLFIPGARLIPTARGNDGKRRAIVWSVEDYVKNAGSRLEESGFFERELGRVQEQYGNVVHLMSSYDSRRTASDPEPFARGVNSFQLFNDGARWYVVTIYWQGETPDVPIPARFLNKK